MAIGKSILGSEKAAAQLQHLEVRIEVVRRKFAKYFNGFDRTPPIVEFDQIKREFREFATVGFATGQARFKAQNLIARWNLLKNIWERDMQRMEEGKFRPNAHHTSHAKDAKIDDLGE